MDKVKSNAKSCLKIITQVAQWVMNTSLALLAIIISVLLVKELFSFFELISDGVTNEYQMFLEHILVFFIYFEFLSMIVKYFKENYHFPMRYFLYIGITAMIRFIIVEHEDPIQTLVYSFVILVLIIGYFIMNITPRERPDAKWFFSRND